MSNPGTGSRNLERTIAAAEEAEPRAPERPASGTRIGRYLIVDALGEGGMGVVYAAYDPQLDRRIALKLLRPREGAASYGRGRLLREAQALAQLSHPNVVAVHDVGVHDDQVFIAMEYVDGQTLKPWMAERSKRREDWREALHVFLAAGRGLAAAHAAGLIHRDFKPDNVMIGRDGRVRVMDFGLARAEDDASRESARPTTDVPEPEDEAPPELPRETGPQLLSTPLTQTGAVMGTPAYMPPEQHLGLVVDERADQFAFCVALYEALYGERPFAGDTVAALAFAVSQGKIRDAPKLSGVPFHLRQALVRGLSADVEARYPHMDALLEALAHDPALRRRQLWVAGLAVAALGGAVTAGILSSTPEHAAAPDPCAAAGEAMDTAWSAEHRSAVDARLRKAPAKWAAGNAERATAVLDAYAERWAAARRESCTATDRGTQSTQLLDLRMSCLEGRLAAFETTTELMAEADEALAREAVEVAASLPRLERCSDTEALLAAVPPPDDPEAAGTAERLDAEVVRVRALRAAGKYDDALTLAERTVEEATALAYPPTLARARYMRASALSELERSEESERELLDAYYLAVEHGVEAIATEAAEDLVRLYGYTNPNDTLARPWARTALAHARKYGDPERLAAVHRNVGMLEYRTGNYDAAMVELEKARTLLETIFPENDPRWYSLYATIGSAAMAKREGKAAREAFTHGLALVEGGLGPDHPNVGSAHMNLGGVLLQAGEFDEAERHMLAALENWHVPGEEEHPRLAGLYNNLGAMEAERGNDTKAAEWLRKALTIREKSSGKNHPDLVPQLDNVGVLERRGGNIEAAKTLHRRALDILEANGNERRKATTMSYLGQCAQEEGNLDEAERIFGEAAAVDERVNGPKHPSTLTTRAHLGWVAAERGEWKTAARRFEAIVTAAKTVESIQPRELANFEMGLARARLELGEFDDALALLERVATHRTLDNAAPKDVAAFEEVLARTLWGLGKDRARARALAQGSVEKFEKAGATEDAQRVREALAKAP